jgi:hypothetical protein
MKKLHDVCTVEGCGRRHKARGYCQTHYTMLARGSSIKPIKVRERNKPECCTEDGCAEPVKSKGLCKMHYQRLLRHGHTRYTDRKKEPKKCVVPSCENWLYAKGLCHSHYAKQRYWQKFGISIGDYLRMHEEQGGVCKICKQPETSKNAQSGKTKDLAIDHCHKTNAIRGLLCSHCNTALGLFEESTEILKSAIKYLNTSSQ